MSLVKTLDAQTGQIKESSTSAPTQDAHAAMAQARERAEKAVVAELHHIEDTFAVAVKDYETRVATLASQLAALQQEHQALAAKHAEAERKLAVLHELKTKLEGL